MDDVEGIDFDDEAWKDVQPIYNSPEEDAVVQIAYSERCSFFTSHPNILYTFKLHLF